MRSDSARKVVYELRTAKQIERRMLIDAFQIMMSSGFKLRDYQYTGMGSLYFVDFSLFHKILGIRDFLSVEYDADLRKRVSFNKPFDLVRIEIGAIGDAIPYLDPGKRHLLWLDYDFRLTRMVVEDVYSAAYKLPPGSILLVTVDVKPPSGAGPSDWLSYYTEQAGDYLDLNWSAEAFAQSELPRTNSRILRNIIRAGLAPGVKFFPLFNFLYADGHPMLTVGGVVGGEQEAEILNRCDFSDSFYVRTDWDLPPYEIDVPKLTRKERTHLDGFMPCAEGWIPEEFEISEDEIARYRELYRFYPTYVEMLL